ncbi:hypothetical protein L7F22_066934 [Adiantum nelumboides]|nr:hypothetical protein [Adiantum nelumboides]
MGEPSSSTSFCAHCERQVPSANFDLHAAHCKRNLERCNLCGDMVAKSRAEEHYDEVHAPVKCSLCEEAIDRELLTLHQNEKCPQRMMACSFCDFPVAAIDLDAHADQCGNRTEMCIPCKKYIRLRERIAHDLHYHYGNENEIGTSSRTHPPPHPRRDQGHGMASKSKLLATVAITGIAIIIGTFVLQKRSST